VVPLRRFGCKCAVSMNFGNSGTAFQFDVVAYKREYRASMGLPMPWQEQAAQGMPLFRPLPFDRMCRGRAVNYKAYDHHFLAEDGKSWENYCCWFDSPVLQ
jgi:hypothetical protein